ncbi:hypothetical protein EB796_019785 [Bugula neritina]|uniref:ZP domain-containing protein n=1 Tax=Bugula neritina TaxID=10212 RepID=A0A7J7J962_BUGNE|nr:hypothetical protein EB796_019785 [Bugula neritina]
MFLNTEAFTAQNLDSTIQSLQSSLEISCENDGIHVSLSRDKVIGLGIISPDQITLVDSQCISEVNRTHFLLVAGIEKCGTDYEISEDITSATLVNKIRVYPPAAVRADADVAGGSGLAELDLSCTYRVDESINSTTSAYSGTNSNSLYDISKTRIEIFSTDSFSHKMDAQQLQHVIRGTSLYVQIQAFDSQVQAKSVHIDSCFINSEAQPIVMADSHFLIMRGCPSDRDVQFKEDVTGSSRRFLFRARRLHGNKPIYLFCTVTPCSPPYCGRKNNSKPALISHAALDVGISVQRRPSPVPITQKPKPNTFLETKPKVSVSPREDKPGSCPPHKVIPCNCPPTDSDQPPASNLPFNSGRVISIEVTIVVVVISFVMGACLILAICYVKKRTDPRRNMQAVSMSDDSSSSQESTMPRVKLMGGRKDLPTSYHS